MRFKLGEAIIVLQRTPQVLNALLHGLPDHWIRANYGPDTFSPFDVVGHLIQGELTDWMPRLRIILERGESAPFPPFDRYAMYEASRGKSVTDLLDEFGRLRRENLLALERSSLDASHMQVRGLHPALGSVTIENLLATWVTHDLHHIAQVCKGLARQYRDEVGPWREYISILG